MIEIFYALIALCVGLAIGFFAAKKLANAHFRLQEEQARARAKAIEFEAEAILRDAQKAQEMAKTKQAQWRLNAQNKLDERRAALQKEHHEELLKVQKAEHALQLREQEIDAKLAELDVAKTLAQDAEHEAQVLQNRCEEKIAALVQKIENISGLTQQEARELLLKQTEEQSRAQIAHIVRKYEEEAKAQAKARAGYILAQATTRYAGDYASERLISVIHLKNDDLKGRIIGKEGRNIKTLEMVLGVDIIIDDTPNAIIISCFNVLRRAIAKRVIELLIDDGRIQPARIEELHARVEQEFEEQMLADGQEVVMDLGLVKMAPELVRLIGRLKYRASYGQNALAHSLEVAHLAGIIADECGGNVRLARRAGILHDIGKALTHEFEGSHVDLGAMVCKRHKEHEVVLNAIYAHHGHEEARSIEAAAVCTADVLSAARPGARREVLEAFLKRVSELEAIAKAHPQVKKAYAINAGREVRVIVNAKLINDDESVLLAKEIAAEVEKNMQFPGEIKVNVIRETRAVEIAK